VSFCSLFALFLLSLRNDANGNDGREIKKVLYLIDLLEKYLEERIIFVTFAAKFF